LPGGRAQPIHVTALLVVVAALCGVAVGSFLNVVIYRVPAKQSITKPPSSCPGCGHPIAPRDNIPILSWLLLKGRCRHCNMRIAPRYPLVEALTGALFVMVALRFGWSWSVPAETIFVAGLVALTFIDYDHLLLPRAVVYPVAGLVFAALLLATVIVGTWHRLLVAVICGAVEFVLLYTINFISPRSLGFGDVRFGGLIGLALGWLGWQYAFLGFLAASLVGAVVGLILIAAGRSTRNAPIPFGVFLSIGAVLAIAFGSAIHYP
jgi:leader peptidase (prepilin peptidase) / N-methyltransferase